MVLSMFVSLEFILRLSFNDLDDFRVQIPNLAHSDRNSALC